MDELVKRGHSVTVCRQDETRSSGPSAFSYGKDIRIISIPTGKITQTTFFEKGVNTLLLEHRFIKKISQFHFASLDVLIYSTPPITFQKVISRLKSKYQGINYLLLKDIFPQNAVDLGIVKKNSFVYHYFRHKEIKLYKDTDIIGCLSPANIKYLFNNNAELTEKIVHIVPNCMFPQERKMMTDKKALFSKYAIPLNAIHFIYGGNIGKPQGVDFITKCFYELKDDNDIFFTVIGNGTEYNKLKEYLLNKHIYNVGLIEFLPKNQYLELLAYMDVGLVFLDNRFTIPNFPSRILDYMNFSLPIIACTDIVCDVKQEICDQGAGFWCRSNDVDSFKQIITTVKANRKDIRTMGNRSYELLLEKYSVPHVVDDMLFNINRIKQE
jgi:glycosyltransferase involved in cell wall biosynthesis